MDYLIGDVQGCCGALDRLLSKIGFSPSRDHVFVLGDLVNRGTQSLETLRRLSGFGDAARRIQELYLAKRKDEAIAAVPDEWVDMKSLVGPPARIRERYRAWEDCGADTISVRSRQTEAIEVMAQAARLN